MRIYSLFDKKAVSFSPLFVSDNNETAKRIVSVSMVSDSMLSSNPSDFSLYCLGEFDTSNGCISGASPIELVCEVLSLMKIDKKE